MYTDPPCRKTWASTLHCYSLLLQFLTGSLSAATWVIWPKRCMPLKVGGYGQHWAPQLSSMAAIVFRCAPPWPLPRQQSPASSEHKGTNSATCPLPAFLPAIWALPVGVHQRRRGADRLASVDAVQWTNNSQDSSSGLQNEPQLLGIAHAIIWYSSCNEYTSGKANPVTKAEKIECRCSLLYWM